MLWLIAAVACLLVWAAFTFVLPAGLGLVHVLLGVGITFLIRGWVLARSGTVS
jgi:hypothetical protein